jgi:DNA-binding response OmpR family regulator
MENKKLSVLFVDDDRFLLDMYIIKFSKNNFDVHTAQDGETALKLLRDGLVIDIMLIDVVIPGMNGVELLASIRKEELIKNTVIIMLTNQGLPDDIAKAKKLNADGYIIKATTIPSEVMGEVMKIYDSVKKK